MAGSFDEERIENYFKHKGFELVERSWAPFTSGGYGEKDTRNYQVIYRDRERRLHRAQVKTSLWSRVYLSNIEIVEPIPALSVETEIAQLQRDLTSLENS